MTTTNAAGSHSHTNTQIDTALASETAARIAADKVLTDALTALTNRVSALEATPPVMPPGKVVTPADNIPALLAAGERKFVLRSGTYRFGFGSSETTYRDVSILPYPGDAPVIDGAGLDPHFVYLGPQSGTWTLGVALRNFFPTGSGVIGIGDGCRLVTVKGFSLVGKGAPASNQDHGVYFHGTGTGTLTDPDITSFPGSALQTYRGSPQVTVIGGRLWGLYVGVFAYSGHMDLTTVDIRGSGTNDIDVQAPATATLTGCTGAGTGGSVRRWDHS